MRSFTSLLLISMLHGGIFSQIVELDNFIGVSNLPDDAATICSIPLVNLDLGELEENSLIPDFQLFTLEGTVIKASDLFATGKPALFISCSYTCPVFRNKIPIINQLNSLYGDLINIYLIYTVEAHPIIDVSPYYGYVNTGESNYEDNVLFRQPTTYLERKQVVQEMLENEFIEVPLLIDGPCNEWWTAFGTNPNCAWLIDSNGIVYKAQEWLDRYPDDIFEAVEKLLGIEVGVSSGMNGTVLYPEATSACITGESGSTIYSGNLIVNDDVQDALIEIKILDKKIPEGWNYSICSDICYPPGVDTANLIVNAGDSAYFGIYFYTAIDAEGEGSIRLELWNANVVDNNTTLIVKACTEMSEIAELELLPNPVSDILTLNANGFEIISLHIYNMEGQSILTLQPNSTSFVIPVTSFASGLYIMDAVFLDSRTTKLFSVLHN